jgi:hypothetical protein
MSKNKLEELLIVGAVIKIGNRYAKEIGGLKAGELITLIEGSFEYDNGLYSTMETAPSIWDEATKDFDSIYHLFGNDLENFLDCEIIKSTTNEQR